MSQIRIAIGGDFCLSLSNKSLSSLHGTALLSHQADLWNSCDYRILNLECPITDSEEAVPKSGPHLKSSLETIRILLEMKVSGLCLANNHIMDFGSDGLDDTLTACRNAGISTVGAGKNGEQARIPLIEKIRGKKIAFLAMAEAEFSIADQTTAGANPIDFANIALVNKMSLENDAVVVILHGGNEHLQYPRPGLLQLCRALVDLGADAVILQHSHCVGCFEEYHGKPIIYGQGNFIFPYSQREPTWYQGLTVVLTIEENKKPHLEFHPFQQTLNHPGIKALTSEQNALFLKDFEVRSKHLHQPNEYEKKWLQYCKKEGGDCLDMLFGLPRTSKRNFPISTWILKRILNPLKTQHMLTCESHREVLIQYIKSKFKG